MPRKSKFPFFRISPEQVELWASRQEWEKVISAANARNYSQTALFKADGTLIIAAKLLEHHQSPESLQALISQLERKTSDVRHGALRAIGKQRQLAALEFLKQFHAGYSTDHDLRDEGVSKLTRHFVGETFTLPSIPVPSRVAENPELRNKLEMLLDRLARLPDSSTSYVVIAQLYGSAARNPESYKYDKGILQVAEQWFLAGLQRWPEDTWLLTGIYRNLQDQEEWSKAATYLEALLRIQPSNGGVHRDLEYSYWQLKEHEKRLLLIETLVQWELKDIQVRRLGWFARAFVEANSRQLAGSLSDSFWTG